MRLDVARGEAQPAFQRLIALNLPDQAAALIASDGHALLMHGHHAALRGFARRFPQTVDANPGVWFCLALERWFNSDVEGAITWIDRLLRDLPKRVPDQRRVRRTARVRPDDEGDGSASSRSRPPSPTLRTSSVARSASVRRVWSSRTCSTSSG